MALKMNLQVNNIQKLTTTGQHRCGFKHLTILLVAHTIDGGTALRGNYAGIGYTWDEDDNIFWPKKPHASWVKHNASASWKSPIGDAPELTEEQISQNTADTHRWGYDWNEANTTWDLTDSKA